MQFKCIGEVCYCYSSWKNSASVLLVFHNLTGSLQTDFNALFGFSNCPRAISKTLLDRLTAVLDQVAIHREHDGVDTRTIDWKQFEGEL